MLILSNALTDVVDEGCVKVAASLVKRLLKSSDNHKVVTFERESELSHIHLQLNKFLLNGSLRKIVRQQKQKVLYLPFPSKPISSAIRIFCLSLFARWGLNVVITMQTQPDFLSRLLLKMSGAEFTVLSRDSYIRFAKIVGEKRVAYLKTGVDTQKFHPVSREIVKELKQKYGLNPERPVVLHVGHLNQGRNVGVFTHLDEQYQGVLVVSTLTKNEQDAALKQQLLSCNNVKLIEDYLPDIQEIYQLADVYLFPVEEYGKCIDVPLSCLEAAACNKPVVATPYGELKEFRYQQGFVFCESLDENNLNQAVEQALSLPAVCNREAVLPYDWDNALVFLQKQ